MKNKLYGLFLFVFGLFFAPTAFGQCDFTLEMTDTFGDGWNGASVEVQINGASVGSFSAEGFGTTETIAIAAGDNIALIYTAGPVGSNEGENFYSLNNNEGMAVFSDGPMPAEGTVYNAPAECIIVETCDWTLNQMDSFGDGWNGGFVTVTVDPDGSTSGPTSTDYTLAGGAAGTATITLIDGEDFDVAWTAGGFNGEVSFDLIDNNGLTAFSSGAGPADGSVFAGADGCLDAVVTCDWTLEAMDSFGDGWNGGNIVVTTDPDGSSTGPSQANYTLAGGSAETIIMTMVDEEDYSIEWVPGGFNGEVSFQIFDNLGNLIAADGPGPTAGPVAAGADGCEPVPPCDIAVALDGVTDCGDGTDGGNTYDANLTFTYSGEPATGDLVVNGQTFPITGSPQAVILTLPSDGQAVDLTASFSDLGICSVEELAFFTAPEQCSDCGSVTTDNGGDAGDYLNNSDVTTTLCPDEPECGEKISITFTEFEFEDNWDGLYIYNSDSADDAALVDSGEGANFNPNGSLTTPGAFSATAPTTVTATGGTGCLTLVLRSDGTVTEEGYIADVTCIDGAFATNDFDAIAPCVDVAPTFPEIFDPCTCRTPTILLDGEVTTRGTFSEEIDLAGFTPGETYTVVSATGFTYESSSADVSTTAPGAVVVPGDTFTDTDADGFIQIVGFHEDEQGYRIVFEDAAGGQLEIANKCFQPRPEIAAIPANTTICTVGAPIALEATDILGSTATSVVFNLNGPTAMADIDEIDPTTLAPGSYTVEVVFTADAPVAPDTVGCVTESSFSLEVLAGPAGLTCNDNVQISLGDDCSVTITPDMILEGADGCDLSYAVGVFSNTGMDLGNVVDGSFIGSSMTVRVTDTNTGNYCWGSVIIEDKIAPTIDCPALSVACTDEVDPNDNTIREFTFEGNITNGAAIAPGDNTYTLDVTTPAGSTINDVNFTLNFLQPTEDDLDITITSPDGDVFSIFDNSAFNFAGCGNDGFDIVLDDDAPAADGSCAQLVTGASVNGSLLGFDNGAAAEGTTLTGVWTVNIANGGADGGLAINIGITATYDAPASAVFAPTAADNCGTPTLSFIDFTTNGDCGGPSAVTTRTWTATDASGNTAQCEQTITFERPTLADVTIPADITIDCAVATEAGIAATAAGAGVPTINGLPIVNGSICNITSTLASEIIIDDICPNTFKIRREWLVVDWCADSPDNEIFQIQYVKVLDSTGPTIDGGTDQLDAVISSFTAGTQGAEHEICEGVVTLPALSWSDDCGTVEGFTTSVFSLDGSLIATVETNGGDVQIPLYSSTSAQPEYQAVYTATDACGNTSTYSENFQTEDRVSPNCVSDEITQVAIGADGIATVNASTFDDGSFDNCTDVHFLVDRQLFSTDMDAYAAFRFYEPTVEFNCADVGQNINVFFLVIDDFMWNQIQTTIDLVGFFSFNASNLEQYQGHFNICMVNVLVEDKLAPFKIQDVANDAIACDNYFNNFAPALDVAEANGDLNPAVLVEAFGDVIYDDNCQEIVTTGWSRNVNSCGVGSITRTWSVTDASNNVGQGCSQTINVFHVNDWNIQFPADQNAVCQPGQDELEGVNFGEPTIFDDDCELIAVSAEDQVFNVVPDACYKVIRTYTAINWCVYDGDNQEDDITIGTRRFRDGGDGIVTYIQTVKVQDSVAPEITNPGTQDYCIDGSTDADGDCDRSIELPEAVVTDCSDNLTVTYTIDGLGTGRNYSNVAPGTYEVTVTAIDNCGNQSTITYDAVVRDCKAPTPYCVGGLVIELMPIDNNGDGIPDAGMVATWASDFNAGSFDNCTAEEDLRIRISLTNDINATADANYNAAEASNIPTPDDANGILTASDLDSGLELTCADFGPQTVFIYFKDEAGNVDYCQTNVQIESVDNVCNQNSPEIAGALTTENGAALATASISLNNGTSTTSDVNGAYALMADEGTDVTVIPEHNVYDNTSVTTFDLLVIRQHILTTALLDSPYKMIAADINNNGAITASDLVAARQVILGMATSYPNNNAWAFVDAAYEFPTNWTLTDGYPAVTNFNNIVANETANFVAVRVGDVNGTYGFADSADERNSMIINANDATLVAGQEVTVEFSAADAVLGYQFTLNFENLEVVSIDGNEENFGVFANAITTSFDTKATDRLFAVTFQATADVTVSEAIALTSNITTAEAYSANGAMNIALEFAGSKDAEFALYQNSPNPFQGQTVIGFNLPTASAATLTISDVSGKVLSITNGEYAKGYNEVRVSDLGATGVLYYQLDTQNNSAVRKMVVID